jgi:hypothetical protein
MLDRWEAAAAIAPGADPILLRSLRDEARQQRRKINRALHEIEGRLALPLLGTNAIRRPIYSDFAYRPELWRGPLARNGVAPAESQTAMGREVTLFHDCPLSEIALRQIRNCRSEDLAPFGLRLDVFRFRGSFLSLAVDLPEAAAQDLALSHVIRVEAHIALERPIEIFMRLNVKHGPNTEQVVRELPAPSGEVAVEFDLAYTNINERRVERMWLDLIFEGPEMNQIEITDLTMIRRPRNEL